MKITAPSPVSLTTSYGLKKITFTKGVAEVDDLSEGVKQYMLSAGYQIEDSAVETAPEGFDPAAHSVEQVLDYLGVTEGHDPVTEDEFARVLEAERAGKARSTLLKALEDSDKKEEE